MILALPIQIRDDYMQQRDYAPIVGRRKVGKNNKRPYGDHDRRNGWLFFVNLEWEMQKREIQFTASHTSHHVDVRDIRRVCLVFNLYVFLCRCGIWSSVTYFLIACIRNGFFMCRFRIIRSQYWIRRSNGADELIRIVRCVRETQILLFCVSFACHHTHTHTHNSVRHQLCIVARV